MEINYWEIIKTVGGSGVVIAAVAGIVQFLAKRTVDTFLQERKIGVEREMARMQSDHESRLAELDREHALILESYRTSLAKSNFVFEKEYEAASELSMLFEKAMNPVAFEQNMSPGDLKDYLEGAAGKIESVLKAFYGKHGVVIPGKVRSKLNRAIVTAGQINCYNGGLGPNDCRALDIWDQVQEVRDALREQVMEQKSA